MSNNNFPAPAESSQHMPADVAGIRGALQAQHTASGAGIVAEGEWRDVDRVITLTLRKLDRPTWTRLRQLAAQAASYANHVIDCAWQVDRGWPAPVVPPKWQKARTPNPDAATEARNQHRLNAERFARRQFTGELSGDVYADVEPRAKAAYARVRGRALHGWQGTPRFGADRALGVRGQGVRVVAIGEDRYGVRLNVETGRGTAKVLPIKYTPGRDSRATELLPLFADGSLRVTRASLVFVPDRGEARIKLAFRRPVWLPPVGERVATIGFYDPDHHRLLVRWETDQRDLSDKIRELRRMKDEFTGIRRRLWYETGRTKGGARVRRRQFRRQADYASWAEEFLRAWTRDLIRWLATQGIGQLTIVPLSSPKAPADWPADRFVAMLKYKGEDAGIRVTEEGAITDASTSRTAEAEVRRRQKKAKRVREALRTIQAEYSRQ